MFQKTDGSIVKEYFSKRFGIPESVFDSYTFVRSSKSFYITASKEIDGYLSLKRIEFSGIRVLRRLDTTLKPTTYSLQHFGQKAVRNIIELTGKELSGLLAGTIIKETKDIEEGYVILKYDGAILGCGLYIEGRLTHRFPKGRAEGVRLSGLY